MKKYASGQLIFICVDLYTLADFVMGLSLLKRGLNNNDKIPVIIVFSFNGIN